MEETLLSKSREYLIYIQHPQGRNGNHQPRVVNDVVEIELWVVLAV